MRHGDRHNILTFVEPTFYHNNFGLQMFGDPALIERFNELAWEEFNASWLDDPRYEEKRAYGAFWQGQDEDWLYIEFWMEKTPENRAKIEKIGREFADKMGIPFRI